MKQNLTLTVTSLLSLLLLTFHQSDDIVLGLSPPGLLNLVGVAVYGARNDVDKAVKGLSLHT